MGGLARSVLGQMSLEIRLGLYNISTYEGVINALFC